MIKEIQPWSLITLTLFLFLLFFSHSVWGNDCGGVGEAACTVRPATLVGKATGCNKGNFFDPIDGGSCWSCPKSYKRTIFSVKSNKACEYLARTIHRHATKHDHGSGFLSLKCSDGQFWDPNGYCWSCLNGYRRTMSSVTSNKACSKRQSSKWSKANKNSQFGCANGSFFDLIDKGTCWQCPKGYGRTLSHVKADDACAASILGGLGETFGRCDNNLLNIAGQCKKPGDCGAKGQRPCLLAERVPSCDKDLKENFKENKCVPLAPGETPFLGGLASLSEVYGGLINNMCQNLLGKINLSSNTNLAVGANCSKNIFVGAGCNFLADKLGAGVMSDVQSALNTGPAAATFKNAVDTAYDKDCSQYSEQLSPATRHNRSKGLDCPKNQFWDPNGYCYSCPQDYTRTLYSVKSQKACVDKPAGELKRSGCSVIKALDKTYGSGIRCTLEILESGIFTDPPLRLKELAKDAELCLAIGEFSYKMMDLVGGNSKKNKDKKKGEKSDADSDLKDEKTKSRIRDFIEKINLSNKIVKKAGSAASASKDLGSQLTHCSGY
jgi:hypothetical protein